MIATRCRNTSEDSARWIFLLSRLLAAGAIVFAGAAARGQALTAPWIELGEGGKAIARIVVDAPQNCPAIQVDGASQPMLLRQPTPPGLRPVCEFAIPAGAKFASVNGRALVLPKADPARVIALGDTGCRVLRTRDFQEIQDCESKDPPQWPFRQVAAGAAREKPDLIVHVGDFLYRESPCPESLKTLCGDIPPGDNWEAWNADFFAPAAELLPAALWVFSRGNHENCKRSWRGWFYYLDPRPWDGACQEYSAPYLVKLGKFEIAMFDTSATNDRNVDDAQAATFAAQLGSLHPENAWLATHYPFWGIVADSPTASPKPLTAVLEAAWEKAAPTGYTFILSGHVHLFEYVSVDHGLPPQLVAGDGGTEMSVPIQASMAETRIRGASVTGSRSRRQFGYTLLTRDGKLWRLELKDQHQNVLVRCSVPGSSESCEGVGPDQ